MATTKTAMVQTNLVAVSALRPAEWNPRPWLQAHRHGGGFENGSPQRLDGPRRKRFLPDYLKKAI